MFVTVVDVYGRTQYINSDQIRRVYPFEQREAYPGSDEAKGQSVLTFGCNPIEELLSPLEAADLVANIERQTMPPQG